MVDSEVFQVLTKNLDLDLSSFFTSSIFSNELIISRVIHGNSWNSNLSESAAISSKLPPRFAILGPLTLALGSTGNLDARVEGGTAGHLILGLFALESRLHVGSWQKLY